LGNRFTIQYGTSAPQPDGPSVSAEPGTKLRLNNSAYSFGEIPQGGIGATTRERLAFLRSHLMDLCDLWAKRPRQFVDLYFRWIDAVIARDRAAIDERLRRFGGLFAREDYTFSALRPLPRAHLPARVDFAFWTGARLVAVDIVGDDARRPAAPGIVQVEIPAAVIARDDPAALDAFLPPEFAAFWQDEPLPSGPFKASALGEFRPGLPEF
jgi:hypothetical protein